MGFTFTHIIIFLNPWKEIDLCTMSGDLNNQACSGNIPWGFKGAPVQARPS